MIPWLMEAGYTITATRFFESPQLPELRDVDLVIAMGGPMSVNDEVELPWLVDEKRFVRQAIEAGTPVLGVCLGAQLIASAMGARVYPNVKKEIGWFPVRGLHASSRDVFTFPESVEVFHWHGETFDLPDGAILLVESDACRNQAFQLGGTAIGLQFHLETTPQTAADLVRHCGHELVPDTYVQAGPDILSASMHKYNTINGLMGKVLSFLTRTPKGLGQD